MLIRLKQVKHYQNNYPKQLHTSFFPNYAKKSTYVQIQHKQAGNYTMIVIKTKGKKIIVSDKLLPQPSLNNNQKY